MIDNALKTRFLAARRAAITGEFRRLNDMQKKAVMTTEGPLLLLAGAGSGKTTVLIHRIGNLMKFGRGSDSDFVPDFITEDDVSFLESYGKKPSPEGAERALSLCAVDPVEPWRIIAITFTNKAANELKSRLEAMLGPQAGDIWAMTFHSACVRILRRDIERLGYDRSFTIYDTADSLSVIKRILKDLGMQESSFPPRSILGAISRSKDQMISPEDFCAEAEKGYDIRQKYIGKVYMEYARRLRAAGALDFDDLILCTVRLLLENPDVREYYQKKFRYVLIDEYQDTNKLQYLLASTLAGGSQNICVVGDDDQSIYKFRGATIENILNFEKQYKNARVIRLEQNYRSTGHILAASNAVIRNNTGRKGKELWTAQPMGDKLRLYIAGDEKDEAQFVAAQILAGFSRGMNWRDFAVLYRMNVQSNQLEFAFKRNGIPYRVFGGTGFFERAEVKDMLAYLCTICNPADDLRLSRIINNPPRGIGAKTVETAQLLAVRENRPVFEILQNCRDFPELQKSAGKLILFVQMIEELQAQLETVTLDEFYDLLLEKSGYLRALMEKDTEENLNRIDNVKELKTNIISYMQNTENGTLAGFLDDVSLYTDLDQMDEETDCVVMMTMHSAKGLEFPSVFIIGAEDGIFPGVRAIGEPEEMEEERRLCYVAMTRAKANLYITCAHHRMLFGRTSANPISRFVEEIPSDDMDRPAPRPAPAYTQWDFGDFPSYSPRETSPKKKSSYFGTSAPAAPLPTYKKGDGVRHKAFGEGVVKSVTPMAGGDALMEIEFETIGSKRLMLKSASPHMEKL